MIRYLRFFWMMALGALLIVIAGCVPQGYQQAFDQAVLYEEQQEYEKAYTFYKQALELQPKDKVLQAKVNKMARLISDRYAEQAIRAYESKRYQTALDLLKKALVYNPANSQAAAYTEKSMESYTQIKALYEAAELAAVENKWLEAVNILNNIDSLYNDDPDINNQINGKRRQGFDWYMQRGLDTRREGRYDPSYKFFESADQIMPNAKSAREVALAKDYLQADKRYWNAREKASQKEIITAMDELLLARELVADHAGVNRLFADVLPAWSGLMLATGKGYVAKNRPDKAFETFATLHSVNPDYPDATRLYLESRTAYLNFSYRNLVRAYQNDEFQFVNVYAADILSVEPLFLDTREIIARALQKRFNRYYQKGLYYMAGNNDGKAILCFRSAEQQLAETALTQDLIARAREKIRRSSGLDVAIWEFFNQIDDPGLSAFATARLNELIQAQNNKDRFKNIHFSFDDIRSDTSDYQPNNMNWIDWGSLTADGYNAAISGDIKQLKLEKRVASEWKIRKRKVRRIVDNPDYARLQLRKAQLNQALIDKNTPVLTSNEAYLELVQKSDAARNSLMHDTNLSKYKKRQLEKELVKLEEKLNTTNPKRPLSSIEVKDELEDLEKRLLATPQKIEKDVDEETPYQVVKHEIIARTRIDVQISMPGGRKLWPVKLFEDDFRVEDTVIPPNLNSSDPKEREGDPLALPSDTEIKEAAIDAIISHKIFPALLKTLNDYGMRFYERARTADQPSTDPNFPSVAFFNAVEDYYRFLACYRDKGETDHLVEEVQQKLDAFVNSPWLISGPKIKKRVAGTSD